MCTSSPARKCGITVDEWLAANEAAGPGVRIEIVGGEFVVHHVGGNPHNHVARRLAEEFERQWPGAPVFVEAFLTDTSDVQLDWHVARGGRRDLVAAARADTELRIDGERPFVVVPNSLLRPL